MKKVPFIEKYFTFRNIWLVLSFANLLLFALGFAIPSLTFWVILALPIALILELIKRKNINPLVELFTLYQTL